MSHIYSDMTKAIGNTPLVEVSNIERTHHLKARLLVKVESFNPGGSVKDRAALSMIDDAVASGRLKPGATIVEPTSGNTGIGLAWIASAKGYKIILTMPDTMSRERQLLLRALGAELVLTPGAEGMKGAMRRADEIREATPGAVTLDQFGNPANPSAHRRTTGEEIWRDTDGEVSIFVAGVGTGGTVSGVGEALKAHNPAIEVVAVEPTDSAVLSGGKPGPHKIQGIGAGFVPGNYHGEAVDRVVTVSNDDAMRGARLLASAEGILAGVSSGAAFYAALRMAELPANEGKTIVALLPDTGERYLSTVLFQPDELPLEAL